MGGSPDRRFSFRTTQHSRRDGETLLAALARDRMPLLRRSVRYHRPQGPFCGVGLCDGCAVRVNGRPNVRACRYEPAEGDVITTEPARTSRNGDVGRAIGPAGPGGPDARHGLRQPSFVTRLYQRFIRRLSGTAAPLTDAAAPALASPPLERSCDVAIVGAGAAGRAVAAELIARGIRPVILERALHPPPLDDSEILGATTARSLSASTGSPERRFTLVAYREPAQDIRIHARSLVLTTGAYDATMLFGGNDRPGVLSAEAALVLGTSPRKPPFRRAVVVGGGARAAEVLEGCGDSIDAVVAPGEIRPEVVRAASDRGVLLYPRSLLLGAVGRRRVRAVRLRGRAGGVAITVPCDAVILAHRRIPETQLFLEAGAALEWRPSAAAYFPTIGANGATTVPGLFAGGSVAGVAASELTTDAAAIAAAVSEGAGPASATEARAPASAPIELVGYYRELLHEPEHGRWVGCRCEDVLLSEVEDAARSGSRGIEAVQRYSRLGTGFCQGRYCLPDALLLLSILEDRPPSAVGSTPRAGPVPLSDRRFN
jgi:sarcosine oxidase, subunit alpha